MPSENSRIFRLLLALFDMPNAKGASQLLP